MGKQRNYDPVQWHEDKEKRLKSAHEALEAGLKAIESDADWKKMLESMAVLGPLSVGRLSFGNQILLQFTAPGAAYAATFMRWKAFGRSVKKGAKASHILQPVFPKKEAAPEPADTTADESSSSGKRPVFFRTLAVFTLDQTDGDPLPEIHHPDFTANEPFAESVERLRTALLALPGEPVSSVALRGRAPNDSPARGWYVPKTREIVVLTDVDRAHQLKTLLHEAAHALLHGAGDHHSRPEQEVEAESTAFVVCHALGVDTSGYSFPYVAHWAGTGDDALRTLTASGARVSRTANTLLEVLLPGCNDEPATAVDTPALAA